MENAVHQHIRQLLVEYLQMYASRDDRLTDHFSDDFSGFTGGGNFLVRDKAAWVAVTRQDFAQVKEPLRIELKDVAIQSRSETIAVATSFFVIHLPIKDHVLFRETARLVLIFRKEASDWKITHSSISIPYHLAQDGGVYPLKQLTESNEKLEQLIAERTLELSTAISKMKTLSGMLPICSSCKKIRDDKNYWNEVENFVMAHSDDQFTHGLCPTCLKDHFPNCSACVEEETPAPAFEVEKRGLPYLQGKRPEQSRTLRRQLLNQRSKVSESQPSQVCPATLSRPWMI